MSVKDRSIIEILLITTITNGKLGLIFSCMLRVRTDGRNRLANKQLGNNLRVCDEGMCITDYNPSDAIAKWCNEKVKKSNVVKLQKYPEKRYSL